MELNKNFKKQIKLAILEVLNDKELELDEKEISSISDAVNLFIEITHNKEENIEVVSTDKEQNVEMTEEVNQEAESSDEEKVDTEEEAETNVEEEEG